MVCILLFSNPGGGLWFLPNDRDFLFFHMADAMADDLRKCFQTLGLDLDADSRQAKLAYRRLAKHWHPDRLDRDPDRRRLGEERIKEINAAYAVVRRFFDLRRLKTQAPDVPEKHSSPDVPRSRQRARETILRFQRLLKALFQLEGSVPPSHAGHGGPAFMASRSSACKAALGSFEAVLQDLIRETSLHGDARRR
jgi:hypothetical protein